MDKCLSLGFKLEITGTGGSVGTQDNMSAMRSCFPGTCDIASFVCGTTELELAIHQDF